jgi:uncharacterized protein
MKCLNCDAEMVNYDVIKGGFLNKKELSYDICEKCGSLWLDAGELDKMAFTVTGSIEFCSTEEDKTQEEVVKKCPRCEDFNLSRVRFLGDTDIVMHHCKNCGGFWLDGGELNLIDSELAKIMPVSGKGFSDFVNNVHVPYWYKKVKKMSTETDFKLESPPIKGAKRLDATSDKCPACGEMLDSYSAFSMKFEECPKCKGLWLFKDELRKLKNKEEGGRLHWLNSEIENLDKASVIPTSRACVKCSGTKLLSVIFGHSSIIIDWCPQCHGMWLDRGEFDSIIEYLDKEAGEATPREMEKEVEKDLKRVATGGSESRSDELGDAEAAISAFINATIFEHPALFKFCTNAAQAGRAMP